MKIRSSNVPPVDTEIESVLVRAMRRARSKSRILIGAPALVGALTLGGAGLSACDVDAAEVSMTEQADWVQDEGQRNTEMVSYVGGWWSECASYTSRFGCSTVDVMLKVRVKPVANANIHDKRVGVVWRNPIENTEHTAFGYYFSTWGNGDEEWHVPVSVPAWRDYFTFNSFYRDGAFSTYYDDNQGEYHVINAGPVSQVIRATPWYNTVAVNDGGVFGTVTVRTANFDWDKEIELVGTTDGWQTVHRFGLGNQGEKNRWVWQESVYGGEQWAMDIDLPGDNVERFEYAVVYRHGVVNGAKRYEFWDNNGNNNYVVIRD